MKTTILTLIFSSFLSHFAGAAMVNTGNPNSSRLSPRFALNLPVKDFYTQNPGCYIACYSNSPGVYLVDTYGVHGLIRVPGSYPVNFFSENQNDRICHPARFGADISSVSALNNLCNKAFPSCQNECWTGGDTGGFFLRLSPFISSTDEGINKGQEQFQEPQEQVEQQQQDVQQKEEQKVEQKVEQGQQAEQQQQVQEESHPYQEEQEQVEQKN